MSVLSGILRRLRLAAAWRQRSPLDPAAVAAAMAGSGLDPWYAWADRERRLRQHAWRPTAWLAPHAPAGAMVETGCGLGTELAWLHRRAGRAELVGIDRDPAVVRTAGAIHAACGIPSRFLLADALAPPPGLPTAAGVLALNWTYHSPGFDLPAFLAAWRPALAGGGVLAIDLIDAGFEAHPLRRFSTRDWQLPEAQRRPSEYLRTHALADVAAAASATGFRLAWHHRIGEIPPRLLAGLVAA